MVLLFQEKEQYFHQYYKFNNQTFNLFIISSIKLMATF